MRPSPALLGSLVVAGAVAAPGLLGDGVDVPDDALYYTVPAWDWMRHALREGLSPWYVPGKLGGISLFADVVPQGPFYPGVLLALILPTVPALGLASLLHALGTVLAVRWLARLRGASEAAACLAGAAVCAGPLGVAAAIDAQVDAWPTFLWLPVALACLEKLGHGRRWLGLGAAAVALLILGSHLRVAAGACAALGLWVLLRGRDRPAGLAMLALGVAAGAPGWVPMLLESRIDGGGSALEALREPAGQALGWTAPAEWLAPRSFLNGRGVSLGAVLGVALLGGRFSPGDRRLLVWAAVLLLAGSSLPGAPWITAPLVLLTHPVNLVYAVLATLPLALLAANAFDRLAAEPRPLPGLWWGAGLLLAAGALRQLLLPGSFHSDHALLHERLAWLQAAATVAGVVWILRRPGRGQRVPLLVGLALLDLALFGLRAHTAVPSEPLRSAGEGTRIDAPHLDLEELALGWDSTLADAQSEAADALLSREAERSVGARRDEVEQDVVVPELDGPAVQRALLERRVPPHQGLATGVFALAGRSKLPPRRQLEALAPLAEAVHDVRAKEYVLQNLFADADGLGARVAAVHGVERAFWGDLVAYALPGSAPACYGPSQVEVLPETTARVQALYAEPFTGEVALLEAPQPAGPTARSVACAKDLMTASSEPGALLVKRVRWHPGWRVESGGEPLATFPVNQVHTGVRSRGGEEALRWRFVPPGLRPALGAAALGWLLILGLLGIGRRAGVPLLALCLLPTAASAGEIHGRVEGWTDRAEYRVLLTTDLDLSTPDQPWASAAVEPGGSFTLSWTGDLPAEHAWLFLDQRIPRSDGAPLRMLRPLDLDPFPAAAPPSPVTLLGVPPGMAGLRASGRPVPAPWLLPLVLTVLLYGFGLAVRYALRFRLDAGEGARRLKAVLQGGEAPRGPLRLLDHRAAPLADHTLPPIGAAERRAVAGITLLAAALRLRGFGAPLELLEHTYGPGSAPLGGATGPLAERIILALWRPSSVEVTHPPVYHWLLGPLDGSEWLLRAPALLASLATVVGVWLLFRRVSRGAGLAAAFAVAIAAPAVHFGHDATPYALVGLVAVSSLLFLMHALHTGRNWAWRAWAGVLALGFLCHYMVGLFALAQTLALAVVLSLRLRGRAWLGAAHRAVGAVLLVAPLPLLWLVVHGAWFGPVALDTRLFADTYPLDPGLPVFLSTFAAVAAGASPDQVLGAVPLLLLMGAGIVVVLRRDRVLGMLLLAMVGGFLGSVLFLHQNLVRHLGGRIFWGFRWVSWFLPLALGLAAAGMLGADPIAKPSGPRDLRATGGRGHLARGVGALLALLWLGFALPATARLDQLSPHPDYRAAAQLIADQLEDRDALAVLPHWSQRGPLSWYVARAAGGAFGEAHGLDAWIVDGRALLVEAVDERLPTESSLRNAHVDRWWLAVVDERVFGRDKFSRQVADRAVEAAARTLTPDGQWSFDGLTLYRFINPPSPAPSRVTAPVDDLASVRWLAPNAETCRAEDDGAEPRWWLQVRVPGTPSGSTPIVQGGELHAEPEPGSWQVLGGPCTGPAPVLFLD